MLGLDEVSEDYDTVKVPSHVHTILKTHTCKRKDEQDQMIIISLEVCRTGKKKQFYTLYSSCLVRSKYGEYSGRQFVKNLSHCKSKANIKACEYARTLDSQDYDEVRTVFFDSPRPIYSKFLAFGSIFMSMSRDRTIWYGTPNKTFWDVWRSDKQGVKNAGFWVRKNHDKTWTLFRRINPSEIIWWNQ